MSFQVGDRFGDYEVLEMLGAGGMGEVYKVRNTVSGRVEAAKVLLPSLEADPELTDRFLREIRVLASLDHPNITRLHTAQRVGDRILMIMEFVEGTTLQELQDQGRVPLHDALGYFCQALSALSYAHARSVIHRDIKPANVMLTPGGAVKLMDFGIAKAASDPKLTQTGRTLGSLYYMSPEQIKGATDLDARSDIYSLGISLYEIATGRRPFQGDSEYSIMAGHLQEAPVPPLEVDPSLPPALNEVILMTIAKDPAQRFQSADALRTALESIGAVAPRPPVPAAPAQAPAAEAATPAARSRTVTAERATAAVSPPGSRRRGLYMLAGSVATLVVIVLAATQVPKWMKTSAVEAPVEISTPPEPAVFPPVPEPAEEEPEAPPAAVEQPDTRRSAPPRVSEAAPVKPRSLVPERPRPVERSPQPSEAALVRSRPQPSATTALVTPPPPPSTASETPQPPSEDPARASVLRELRKELMLMATRIGPVKDSLANIRQSQARAGLGLRGDIAASEQRLEFYMDEAESSLRAADPEAARENLRFAEQELTKLERFLGR